MNGVPDRGEASCVYNWKDVLVSEPVPDLGRIRLTDPDKFVAGGVHRHPEAWE